MAYNADGGNVQSEAGAPECPSPRYAYGSWEELPEREERWFDGQWVMQRRHFRREKEDLCDGSITYQYRTEVTRLWQAVPDQHVDEVNGPARVPGAGAALPGTSDLPAGPAPAWVGPRGGTAEMRPPATTSEGSSQGRPPEVPFLPSPLLLAGVAVAFWEQRRRQFENWFREQVASALPWFGQAATGTFSGALNVFTGASLEEWRNWQQWDWKKRGWVTVNLVLSASGVGRLAAWLGKSAGLPALRLAGQYGGRALSLLGKGGRWLARQLSRLGEMAGNGLRRAWDTVKPLGQAALRGGLNALRAAGGAVADASRFVWNKVHHGAGWAAERILGTRIGRAAWNLIQPAVQWTRNRVTQPLGRLAGRAAQWGVEQGRHLLGRVGEAARNLATALGRKRAQAGRFISRHARNAGERITQGYARMQDLAVRRWNGVRSAPAAANRWLTTARQTVQQKLGQAWGRVANSAVGRAASQTWDDFERSPVGQWVSNRAKAIGNWLTTTWRREGIQGLARLVRPDPSNPIVAGVAKGIAHVARKVTPAPVRNAVSSAAKWVGSKMVPQQLRTWWARKGQKAITDPDTYSAIRGAVTKDLSDAALGAVQKLTQNSRSEFLQGVYHLARSGTARGAAREIWEAPGKVRDKAGQWWETGKQWVAGQLEAAAGKWQQIRQSWHTRQQPGTQSGTHRESLASVYHRLHRVAGQ